MPPATHTRLGIYDDLDGRTLRHVGVSEMAVSADPKERLVTFSLGSCIGLTVYDPVAAVGGLLHCLMPDSACNKADAQAHPARYIDTGISLILCEVEKLGAMRQRLIVSIAGACSNRAGQDLYQVGGQNMRAVRRGLALHHLSIAVEEVGGGDPLTMTLDIDSGVTLIRRRSMRPLAEHTDH